MFRLFKNKIANLYYISILYKIPPEYHGFMDWVRILFWNFPKFVLIPRLTNLYNKLGLVKLSSKIPPTHSGSKNSKIYISYEATTEGIGGQLCRYSTAIILSDLFKLNYVHNPFSPDFHHPNINWQKFLGFSDKVIQYKTILTRKNIKVYPLPKFDLRYLKGLQINLLNQIFKSNNSESDILFLITGYSFFPMNEYENWNKILVKMKSDYQITRRNFPISNHFVKNTIHIAVLIRRGEVTDLYKKKTFQGISRWVPTSWYKSVISKLITICKQRNVQIEIYSDAKSVNELAELRNIKNTHIHLSGESAQQPFEAFHTMTVADIVICGLSSFPYFAASLSNGIKIVPPTKSKVNYFPSAGEPGWLFPDQNGNFDDNFVKKYLLLKKYD